MITRRVLVALLALGVLGCTRTAVESTSIPDLPTVEVAEFRQMLAASDKPVVVNVWASWCLPCREEAPVFTAAHEQFGDRVSFIGLNFNDNQTAAKEFLAEFDLPFPHYFDQTGALLAEYGGIGVPRTYFFAAGGEQQATHNGIVDEETLTRRIEELLG